MKTLLSSETIHDVLQAITVGDRETVDKYMLRVQDHFTEFVHLSDEKLKPALFHKRCRPRQAG